MFDWIGFPGGSDGKESVCNMRDLGSNLGSGRIPWRKEGHPTPGLLPGESHRQEPGGLQSMASQRVGHGWATNTRDLIVKVIKNCVAGLSCFSGFVYSFISWLRWVLLLCAGFSSCGVRLLTAAASLVPTGLRAGGHRGCGSWALEHGLIASRCMGSSRIWDRTHLPCTGRWVLNHWTAREALRPCVFF